MAFAGRGKNRQKKTDNPRAKGGAPQNQPPQHHPKGAAQAPKGQRVPPPQDERTGLPVEEARHAAQIKQSHGYSAADNFSALRP